MIKLDAVTTTMVETWVNSPYIFTQKYLLGNEPRLDEPKDDRAMRRGNVLEGYVNDCLQAGIQLDSINIPVALAGSFEDNLSGTKLASWGERCYKAIHELVGGSEVTMQGMVKHKGLFGTYLTLSSRIDYLTDTKVIDLKTSRSHSLKGQRGDSYARQLALYTQAYPSHTPHLCLISPTGKVVKDYSDEVDAQLPLLSTAINALAKCLETFETPLDMLEHLVPSNSKYERWDDYPDTLEAAIRIDMEEDAPF